MGSPDEHVTPLVPEPDTVILRMYGVGLGDCFLLAFPKMGGGASYFVIDCGIAAGTPEESGRIKAIVRDIKASTAGKVNVLAITHEHYDHVSGFTHAREVWDGITVDEIWLPWLDKEGEWEAEQAHGFAVNLSKAAKAVVEFGLGAADSESRGILRAEAGFLGASLSRAGMGAVSVEEAYDIGSRLTDNIIYCEPGDFLTVPNTACGAYVLGPPRNRDKKGNPLKKGNRFLLKLLEDEAEMYSYRHIGMEPDNRPGKKHHFAMAADKNDDALANAILGNTDEEYDRYCPFDRSKRIAWEDGMSDDYFFENYVSKETWRRVDEDWLASAAQMALRAGDYTNNISLALAFELPKSKRTLLFPGDAQVGNWLSWHSITNWDATGGVAPSSQTATAEDILNRVIFYKAGHHGSHNGTIREKGLEMMALKDGKPQEMVSYVPVSLPVAHDVLGYCPMPFYPIMRRLQDKTNGLVYLSNGQTAQPYTGPAPVGRDETGTDGPHDPVRISEHVIVQRSEATVGDRAAAPGTPAGAIPLWTQFIILDKEEE